MQFPHGKRFAFSILDDTDDATVENVQPVYARLAELGLRTTKTVWPVPCPEGSRLFFAGQTLGDEAYLQFVRTLHKSGFEIAFHGATMESSLRERTMQALEVFRREFGAYPTLHCNHGFNKDNLYWGLKRFQNPLFKLGMRLMMNERSERYEGDDEQSPYFWGDLCERRIRYVRNFTFHSPDMLRVNAEMPYRLRSTKYAQLWFSTADAPDVRAFNRLFSVQAMDRLAEQGGVCIVSTHLGKGFSRSGSIHPETDRILTYLSGKPGWFVPVSEILDYLRMEQGRGGELSAWDTFLLECRYVWDRLTTRVEPWLPDEGRSEVSAAAHS